MRYLIRHTTLLIAFLALSACGTRGSLDLPPGPAPTPLFGNPASTGARPVATRPAAPAAAQDKPGPRESTPETSARNFPPTGPTAGGDLSMPARVAQ